MRPLDDRFTGYATENVEPITAMDRATIDELWSMLRAAGGPLGPARSVMVGEDGPELILPPEDCE